MSDHNCPVCGSSNLQKKTVKKTIKDSFAGDKTISVVEYLCPACGSEGDLFNENDSNIEATITLLKQRAAVNILEDFAAQGSNLASMERILELPQRTLSKWKNGSTAPSAAGTTLLKFVRTFPWLLEVAENNFESTKAQQIYLMRALEQFITGMRFDNKSITHAGLITSTDSTVFFLRSEKQEGPFMQQLANPQASSSPGVEWRTI